MGLRTRVAAALVLGCLAAVGSSVALSPVVSSMQVWFGVVLNAIVWTAATMLYLQAWTRLQRLGETADAADQVDALKWGNVAGGYVSVGVAGIVLFLVDAVPFRFAAVVLLFVFGFGLGIVAVGMGVIAERIDGERRSARDGADASPPGSGE